MLELFKGMFVYSVIVYMMLLTVLFGLLVVAALSVLVGTGVLLCALKKDSAPWSYLVVWLLSSLVS
jgi:hypothetical protein